MSNQKIDLRILNIEDLEFMAGNPRLEIYDDELRELSNSIVRDGLIEPIVVRPSGNKYEVMVGERRVRASILGNITKIQAIIREGLTNQEASRLRLIENMERKDLTIVEKVNGIEAHMERFGTSIEDIAVELNTKPSTVRKWFGDVRRLSPNLKSDIAFLRKLSPDILALLGKYNFETQERLAKAIDEHKLTDWTARRFTDMFEATPEANLDELAEKSKKQVKTIAVTLPIEEAEKVQQQAREIRKKELKASKKLKKYLSKKEKRKIVQPVIEKSQEKDISANPSDTTTVLPIEMPSIRKVKEIEVANISKRLSFSDAQTRRLLQLSQQRPDISTDELTKEVLEEKPPTQIMVVEVPGNIYHALDSYANSRKMYPKEAALGLIEEGLERYGFWKRREKM
jgi:ParB/RepB/Spo0J family partition protein